MGEHRLHFGIVQRLHQPGGDTDLVLRLVDAAGEGIEGRILDDRKLGNRHPSGNAEIFEKVIEPGMALARHLLCPGRPGNHRGIEGKPDPDPSQGQREGDREVTPELPPGIGKDAVERRVEAGRIEGQGQRKGHDADKQEKAGNQEPGSPAIVPDMGVEAECLPHGGALRVWARTMPGMNRIARPLVSPCGASPATRARARIAANVPAVRT